MKYKKKIMQKTLQNVTLIRIPFFASSQKEPLIVPCTQPTNSDKNARSNKSVSVLYYIAFERAAASNWNMRRERTEVPAK